MNKKDLVEVNHFPNLGYLRFNFSEFDLEPVKKEIFIIKENFKKAIKHNKDLAGHIKHEYLLNSSIECIENLMHPLIKIYDEQFNSYVSIAVNNYGNDTKPKKIILDKVWVNFQKKHEFNPIHSHRGVLSFVIWLEIPFLMEDELMLSPGRLSNDNIAGHFNFHYINSIGEIVGSTIPADKSFEKNVILFPSSMKHSVAPFYSSDDYRISVAGNFVVYQNEI